MADSWNLQGPTAGAGASQSLLGLPSGTKTSDQTTGGSTAGTEKTNAVTSSSSSQANMTPAALAALNSLVSQLSDHPQMGDLAIQAELSKQGFRTPQRVWSNDITGYQNGVPIQGGWTMTDERGMKISTPAQYDAAVQRYQAAKDQVAQSGGMVAGGTVETQQVNAQRQTEISRDRGTADKYSKDAAFADASNLTNRFTRQMLETIMPDLNRTVEASGTSGGAVAGLLKNDAAARTGEAAAALGLQASEAYGQINAQFSTILEQLTKQNPVALESLLSALNISKGAVQVGSQVQSTSGTKTTSADSTQQQTGTEDIQGRLNLPKPATTVSQPVVAAPASVASKSLSIAKTSTATDPYAGVTF